ncbi:MAG TPA: metal-dependent hydrolase [Pirellulales bacterium]|nr:metal-dependent hydrolase [Pirellulales bacterium]
MAGFKTHITTSTILGIGGGAAAYTFYHLPAPTCILAAGLCGVSGMLPDLDSGPGRPLRESMAFAAAVVPMAMVERFKAMGLGLESMILVGGAMYLFIRFGLAALLRRFTVHRGMFHSFPACAIAGETVFLVFGCEQTKLRYFVAGAAMVGFMSHLILDEIWSIEFKGGRPHLKSSFGTAMKFWGPAMGPNILTYLLLAGITFFAVNDPVWMSKFGSWADGQRDLAARVLNKLGLEGPSAPPANATQGSPPPMVNINAAAAPMSNFNGSQPSALNYNDTQPPMVNLNGSAPVDDSRR